MPKQDVIIKNLYLILIISPHLSNIKVQDIFSSKYFIDSLTYELV